MIPKFVQIWVAKTGQNIDIIEPAYLGDKIWANE